VSNRFFDFPPHKRSSVALCPGPRLRPFPTSPRRTKEQIHFSEVHGRSASQKCLENCLDSISTQRRTAISLRPQKRKGNLVLLHYLAFQPQHLRARRTRRRRRIAHRRRRHFLKRRVGGHPLTCGRHCSCRALRLVRGRGSPPSSCVNLPHGNALSPNSLPPRCDVSVR